MLFITHYILSRCRYKKIYKLNFLTELLTDFPFLVICFFSLFLQSIAVESIGLYFFIWQSEIIFHYYSIEFLLNFAIKASFSIALFHWDGKWLLHCQNVISIKRKLRDVHCAIDGYYYTYYLIMQFPHQFNIIFKSFELLKRLGKIFFFLLEIKSLARFLF